jgi:serine/threonine protein phosphatase PrpC
MIYDHYSYTDKGGKDVNEDSVRFKDFPDGLTAVVADGVGSNGGGDIASAITADMFCENLFGCFDEAAIKTLFDRTNNYVLEKQTHAVLMKSTLAALRIKKAQALFVHAGDSRGYIFRNGEVLFHTLDHSIPQMDVMRGKIKPSGIRSHPARNRILRALGIDDMTPDISAAIPLRSGDALLLCSDGFWQYILEDEMAAKLIASQTPEMWIKDMTDLLFKRVKPNHDNLSAIAIFCK